MATSTNTAQPTVMLTIAGSYIAFDDEGEIVESVELHPDGSVDWTDASICDDRGIGGPEGYAQLRTALDQAEANARLVIDGTVTRVASEFMRGA